MHPRHVRFVSCTRSDRQEFLTRSLLGHTVSKLSPILGRNMSLDLYASNIEGLPAQYNKSIEKALKEFKKDELPIMLFVHDDVRIEDLFFYEKLVMSMQLAPIVGLAGSSSFNPLQEPVAWPQKAFKDKFSGCVWHVHENNVPLPSFYGAFQPVVVLDGLFLAVDLQNAEAAQLRFDERFKFHFYDIDLSVQACMKQIGMITAPIHVLHGSKGSYNNAEWGKTQELYLAKWRPSKLGNFTMAPIGEREGHIPEDELTIATCSYNTPAVTEVMIKSFMEFHPNLWFLISENSTNEETLNKIDDLSPRLAILRSPGSRHAPSVDKLIQECKTKYMLLVDTDIMLNKNIAELFKAFKTSGAALGGLQYGDRGDYLLHPRVHPWFCIIDTEKVRELGVKFYDPERLSEPNDHDISKDRLWDVGSSFYYDLAVTHKQLVMNISIDDYMTHFEGMSWHVPSFNKELDKSRPGFSDMSHSNNILLNIGLMTAERWKQTAEKRGFLPLSEAAAEESSLPAKE
jgi:hypothetical protein